MKFSIRDLFWLVLVCAFAAGWWVDRTNLARQLDAVTRELDSYRFPTDSLFGLRLPNRGHGNW
jgi:hypothetical protein